jgi:hypothetical protein
MQRILGLVILLWLLAACDGGAATNSGAFADNSIIRWEREPGTVVFRAEVVGGSSAGTFLARNRIPLCTIYGDNRIVWLNDLGDFNVQVLWDQPSDQQIQDFIAFMTISQLVFNYDAGADLQMPGEVQPVVEVITVNVNEREHVTDSFSSVSWPLDYFQKVVEFCGQVSRSPVLFEPTGAWLTLEQVEYDSTRPLQVWNSETTGVNFAEIAAGGEPAWLTGQPLRILWNIARTSPPQTLYIDADGNSFNLVLEVPGVHPTSPPAPAS